MAIKKTSISVYLLRPTMVAEAEKALFSNAIPLADGLDGYFVPVSPQQQEPSWLRAVKQHIAQPDSVVCKVHRPLDYCLYDVLPKLL